MSFRVPLGPMARLLLLGARGQRSADEDGQLRALFAEQGEPAVREAARANKVEALVGEALRRVGADLSDDYEAYLEANERRVASLVEACAAVARRMAALGCRHAVVESGGTLLGSDQPLAAFGSGDFDLLLEPGRWDEVLACFEAEGFTSRDRRDRPTNRAELFRDDGLWLAPGTAPFDRMWVPLAIADRTAHWLAHTVPSRKNADIHVLAPEHALAFVAMHTSLHSFVRSPGLRLHVDVDRTARDNALDWAQVGAEIEALGAPTRAYVSLAMARTLLGTPIPPEVTAALAPGAFRERSLWTLLSRAGVLADGRPKLPRAQAVVLDALLDDHGAGHWARSVALPPADWMREHFARGGPDAGPAWPLHVRRLKALATRWRPE